MTRFVLVMAFVAACGSRQVRDEELHRKLDALASRETAAEEQSRRREERCRGDEEMQRKLDYLLDRMEALERKVDSRGVGVAGGGGGGTGTRRPAPDAAAVYAVDITGAPWRGVEHAKVTIVMATEFACPFCERVRRTIDQLLAEYPKDLKVVWKSYVVHPQTATIPAMAACAAHKQGKFWEMFSLLFDKAYPTRDFGEQRMRELAADLGLDATQFDSHLTGLPCKQLLEDDQNALRALGVSGTPAFFINGRFLSGAQPIDNFKALIDEELKKADAALKADKKLKVKDYYRKEIFEKGKGRS
jgi:protein-disulfide isomerase